MIKQRKNSVLFMCCASQNIQDSNEKNNNKKRVSNVVLPMQSSR